jgi:F-type H+-transporting ATPase subunit gamma
VSNLKIIRRRISSVSNTKQITRAMKLVSAAKLRRAQEGALGGRSYAERLGGVLANVLVDLSPGFRHPLLEFHPQAKKKLIVYVAGERGLCGSFNSSVFKEIAARESAAERDLDFIPVGKKAVAEARKWGWTVVASFEGLAEDAALWPLDELRQKIIEGFVAGEYTEVVLYYTKFISVVRQEVTKSLLLPLDLKTIETGGAKVEEPGVVGYDPRPEELLGKLLPLLLSTKLRQAGLESKASEHAARMRAMDSATRNADELIEKLRLYYNRARQRAITTELIDIVGGAEAQS